MSKKKLKKFKKGGHTKHKGNIAPNSTQSITQKRNELIDEVESLGVEAEKEEETEPDIYMSDKYDHVKKDIKKILIIMLSIFIILFGVYYLSLKTTYLASIGDWIYKILNIQA